MEVFFWNKQAEATKASSEILFGERDSEITKTIAFYEFNDPFDE